MKVNARERGTRNGALHAALTRGAEDTAQRPR